VQETGFNVQHEHLPPDNKENKAVVTLTVPPFTRAKPVIVLEENMVRLY
jgi:hypothetical protein